MLVATQWPLKHACPHTSLAWVCVIWRAGSPLELSVLRQWYIVNVLNSNLIDTLLSDCMLIVFGYIWYIINMLNSDLIYTLLYGCMSIGFIYQWYVVNGLNSKLIYTLLSDCMLITSVYQWHIVQCAGQLSCLSLSQWLHVDNVRISMTHCAMCWTVIMPFLFTVIACW